jgi:hypothetical protein
MNVARIPRLVVRPSRQFTRHYATEVPRRPIGGFRGGLFGFILGVTLTGAVGYYYLLDEYHAASSLLLNSVEELQASTNRVRRLFGVANEANAYADTGFVLLGAGLRQED